MKHALSATALLVLTACGGGGGGESLAPPPTPTPTPQPPPTNDPAPSALFSDVSATLPDARNADCFDAHAFDDEVEVAVALG
ncbi:MAG: hypothetical protein AAFN78_20480, partial [Pseudomonadota bacterium]